MFSKSIEITNHTGLHARPASDFVNEAKKFNCKIIVEKGEQKIDGKSILGLLGLGAGKGAKITITADGTDEEEAVNQLVRLIHSFNG